MPSKILSLQGIISQSVSAGNQSEQMANSMMNESERASNKAMSLALSDEKRKQDVDPPEQVADAATTGKSMLDLTGKVIKTAEQALADAAAKAKLKFILKP